MARKKKVIQPEAEEVVKIKATPKVNIGTDKKGKIRYQKGVEYEFTQEQIDNYKLNKLI